MGDSYCTLKNKEERFRKIEKTRLADRKIFPNFLRVALAWFKPLAQFCMYIQYIQYILRSTYSTVQYCTSIKHLSHTVCACPGRNVIGHKSSALYCHV